MKTAYIKFLLYVIAIALVSGFMVEVTHVNARQSCSCCDDKCQGATKCHDAAKKTCLCSNQTAQAFLPQCNILPEPTFAGCLEESPRFSFPRLFTENIFHPPKA